MFDKKTLDKSPLSLEEISRIEATNLSSLDRYHLRLLAHCLQCFKSMAGSDSGPLPDEQARLKWCIEQPTLVHERPFISVLLEQFAVAGNQLERLATDCETSPLALTLDDLIKSSISSKEDYVEHY